MWNATPQLIPQTQVECKDHLNIRGIGMVWQNRASRNLRALPFALFMTFLLGTHALTDSPTL